MTNNAFHAEYNPFEEQYLGVLNNIIDFGHYDTSRTGINTYKTWGQTLHINLQDGFPIITTRKTSLRIAFEETWFFLRGETDTKKLEEKKINIWKGNTSREFLDKVGLDYLPEGHLGKGYSFQWRNFGGEYPLKDFMDDPKIAKVADMYDYTKSTKGVDQVVELLEGMKKDPNGRRHIITGWNPEQIRDMALPPCHLYQQYQVAGEYLNSMFLMRSWDYLYGAPFNIMGYALLNHAFAKFMKLKPGVLVAMGCDVHLYENQLEIAKVQAQRTPFELPQIEITKELNTLDDILSMEYSDIKFITPYKAHPDFKDKPPMAV